MIPDVFAFQNVPRDIYSLVMNVHVIMVFARTGIFSRWHFADMAAKREDAPRDMWKYWNGEAVLAALRRAKGEEQPVRTVLESKVTVTEGGWRYFEGSVQYSTEGVSSRL